MICKEKVGLLDKNDFEKPKLDFNATDLLNKKIIYRKVKTKQGSNDDVEFAIKLPGKDDQGKEVYLPIDAKFPQEDYVRLQTAYDEGDAVGIEVANRALVQSIKKFA